MSNFRQVAVSLEHRFFRVEGKVYTTLSFPYQYWEDYLDYFDKVVVIARVQALNSLPINCQEASGPNVEFYDFPYYVGPVELFKKIPQVIARARSAALLHNHFLLRSGNISNFLWFFLLIHRKKYLREFPGNIKEGVQGVAGKKLHIKILASFLHNLAKLQGRFSQANSFVSQYCSKIYGSSRPGYIFSSFQLGEISEKKIAYEFQPGSIPVIVSVGRLEGEKGHADLVCALAMLSKRGKVIKLQLVGDGRQKATLKSMCIEKGVDCEFYGSLTDRQQLFAVIRSADLFVIPSHTEGMPRALLEAMAIGMPCIGTRAGGVPEVLSDDAVVKISSPYQLANKILEFLDSYDKRKEHGELNAKMVFSRFGGKEVQEQKLAFWSSLYE